MRRPDPLATLGPAASAEPVSYADVSVAWSARILQPAKWSRSSVQILAFEVSGPIVLEAPVYVSTGSAWVQAEWIGEAAQKRQAVVSLGRSLRPDVGLVRVSVKVNAGAEQPVLRAGTLRVTR